VLADTPRTASRGLPRAPLQTRPPAPRRAGHEREAERLGLDSGSCLGPLNFPPAQTAQLDTGLRPQPETTGPAETPGPAIRVRRGHLTVRIPPPARHGLGGGSAAAPGAGEWRRRQEKEAEAEAEAAAEAGAGRGEVLASRHTGSRPSDTSREIASRQPIERSRKGAGQASAGSYVLPQLPFLRTTPQRCPHSTGWRESQKVSAASEQDGCRGGVRIRSFRDGMATSRLSPKRRSQLLSSRSCEAGRHGAGREGLGA
jgi:hypothetical protein